MQYRPDKGALLDAVATFLDQQVRPAASADPALAFRVRIAANLARIAAQETRVEDAHDASELASLLEILPEEAGQLPKLEDGAQRREAIMNLNAVLARRIRAGDFDGDAAVTSHLRRTLIQKLAVTNPRFDTSLEVEE